MLTPEQNDAIFGPSIRVFRINTTLNRKAGTYAKT